MLSSEEFEKRSRLIKKLYECGLSTEEYKEACDGLGLKYIEMVKVKPDGHKVTIVLPIDQYKKKIDLSESKFQRLIKLMS